MLKAPQNPILFGLSLVVSSVFFAIEKPVLALPIVTSPDSSADPSTVEFQPIVFEAYDSTDACFSTAIRTLDYFEYRYKNQDPSSFPSHFDRLESVIFEGPQDLAEIFPKQPDCISLFQQIDFEKYTLIGTRFWGATLDCSIPGPFLVNLIQDDEAKAYRQIYISTALSLGCHGLPRHLFWIGFEKDQPDYSIEFEAILDQSNVIFACDDIRSSNYSCYPADSSSDSILIRNEDKR